MKKTDTFQGSLDLVVLTILSRRPKLHGYALMTAIKETSGEVLSAEWVVKENGKRVRIYQGHVSGSRTLSDAGHGGLRFCVSTDRCAALEAVAGG